MINATDLFFLLIDFVQFISVFFSFRAHLFFFFRVTIMYGPMLCMWSKCFFFRLSNKILNLITENEIILNYRCENIFSEMDVVVGLPQLQ